MMAKFTSSSKLARGTDAGLTGGNSLFTQIKGVLWIGLFVVALAVVWVVLATPELRVWGLAGAGVLIAAIALWKWRKRSTRPSLEDTLTDLGD